MIRPFIPHHQRRLATRMDRCLEGLLNLMCARVTKDKHGLYVCGFDSEALSERAAENPEPGVWPWFESEGAKLIFRAVDEDRAGSRIFATLWMTEGADTEQAIIEHAQRLVPAWCRATSAA